MALLSVYVVPNRDTEKPIMRPDWLVDDIEVSAAAEQGAEIAHEPLELPGREHSRSTSKEMSITVCGNYEFRPHKSLKPTPCFARDG